MREDEGGGSSGDAGEGGRVVWGCGRGREGRLGMREHQSAIGGVWGGEGSGANGEIHTRTRDRIHTIRAHEIGYTCAHFSGYTRAHEIGRIRYARTKQDAHEHT
jgi:hypothetical protein